MSAYCVAHPIVTKTFTRWKWQVDEVLDQRGHKLYPISALFAAVDQLDFHRPNLTVRGRLGLPTASHHAGSRDTFDIR